MMKSLVLVLITILTVFSTFAAAVPTLDQYYTNSFDAWSHNLYSNSPLAQTFTAGISGGLTQISLPFTTAVSAPVKVSIVEMYNSQPIGNTLGSVNLASLSTGWNNISFADQNIYLTADTKYAITLDYYGQTTAYSAWKWTAYTTSYSRGEAMMKLSGTWKVQGGGDGTTYDFWFQTYIDPDFVSASPTVPAPSAILLVAIALPVIRRLKKRL